MSEAQLVKQEQYELEEKIHACGGEAGLQYMLQWLTNSRNALTLAWPTWTGEALLRAQGYAGYLNDAIRVIENGPKLKRQEPVKLTGGNNG